jgi:2-polyprenyl-3-methyl-5-hydroxy-6-metoxy-1,4-benzoquinol methylase
MTDANGGEPCSQQTKQQGGYDYTHYVEDYLSPIRGHSLEDFETAYEGTLSRLDFSERSRILDVGGGAGQMVAVLTRRGCSATLLDVSEGGVAFAKEICAEKLGGEAAQRIRFEVGDLSSSCPRASLLAELGTDYDVIILRQVWEHLTPRQCDAMMNNCRSLLASTGHIYIEGHLFMQTVASEDHQLARSAP